MIEPSGDGRAATEITVDTIHFGPKPMRIKRDVPVSMRDGARLLINLFLPTGPGPFPVVLSADIFGKDGANLSQIPATAVFVSSAVTAWESPDPGFWVPGGYAVIKAGLRGSSGSDGRLDPMSRIETEDLFDLIGWAGTQAWSNGRIGTNGVSYLAMVQWKVAALNPPHLKAMIPWEGVSDVYREWSYHGGIPEIAFSRNYFKRWLMGHDAAALPPEVDEITRSERDHPLLDAYWDERVPRLGDIRVPMYVGASWSTQGTHSRGALEGFRQAASEQKWLEIHGRKEWEYYYARECLERQKRFFDHFLKQEPNDWLDTPRVRLEVRDSFYEGEVRQEAEWPLSRTEPRRLHLDLKAMALRDAPVAQEASVSYAADPAGPGGVELRYVFESDTELTGYVRLRLWVAAEASDDMDLFVGLKKYDRRGQEVHFAGFNHIENGQVSSGWLRVTHRATDPARSTELQPWLTHRSEAKLSPGELVAVDVEILPSSTRFRAGERLGLVIQAHEILDTGPLGYAHSTINRGRHSLFAGGARESYLIVPIVPGRS